MNDASLYANKFQELIELARNAETGFEKAAIFAATQALANEFTEDDFDGYALEKVEGTRWHICASLGYDITNGHSPQQHLSWAFGSVITLKNVLEKNK